MERLVEGVPSDVAASIIATASSPEAATEALQAARQIDMTRTVLHSKREFDPENPFDIEG